MGHDHGARLLGWDLGRMHPEIFTAYMAVSIPWTPWKPKSLIQKLREEYGDELELAARPRFQYMLHHHLSNAENDYARDTPAALRALLQSETDSAKAGPPLVTSNLLFVNGQSEPLWVRLPQPGVHPSYMTDSEFEFYVRAFQHSG